MNLLIVNIILITLAHQRTAQSIDTSFNQPTDNPLFDSQPDSFTNIPLTPPSNDNESNLIVWPVSLLNLNYSSLIQINKNCPNSRDRCDYGSKRSRELDILDCSCDKDCRSIGDCCLDSAILNKTLGDDEEFLERLERFNAHRQEFDCKELAVSNTYRFVQVKSNCPADFKHDIIRNRCEMSSFTSETQFSYNYTDPYQSVPVTSTESRITYSNIFCALCNEYKENFIEHYSNLVRDDTTTDLKFWKMGVSCDGVMSQNLRLDRNSNEFQQFLKNNFTYDSKNEIWTLEYTNAQGVLEKRICSLQLYIPEDVQFFIKSCKPNLIDKCSPIWSSNTFENRSVEALCRAYQSRVNHLERKQEYSNVHCAICNFVDISQLGCPSNLIDLNDGLKPDDGRSTHLQAFNSIFDVNYSIGKSNMVGKISMNNYCPQEDSIYDPFFQKCRSLICGFNQMFSMGECRLPPIIKSIESTTDTLDRSTESITVSSHINSQSNETELSINETSLASDQQSPVQFTAEFRKCAKIRLTSGYFELKNDSIHLHQYDLVVDKGNYNLTNSELLICVPFSPLLDKFENHYSSIAYICLIFSIICLALYLIIFCFVAELRNLSGRNLSSLCVSLILVYFCFAISPLNLVQKDVRFCRIVAFIKYYGLLASFCWTGVIAIDIYQTIRNSLNAFQYKTGPQHTRFLIYSSICWLFPMLAVAFVWLVDFGELNLNIPQEFRPNFGMNKECWFFYRKSLLIFFVLPVGVITFLNLIFFLLTSKNLLLTRTRNKMKLSGSSTSKFDFNLYLRLFLLMGLTWMFGFLATYFDKIYLWYLFTIFNTLQGVFIFIAFGCKRTVMKRLKIRLAKLFLSDDSNVSKNSSLSTACRGTLTNQSTITHLKDSISNKILSVDQLNDFKQPIKDHLSNRLNEQSKSLGDDLFMTKNAGSLNFYSSDRSLSNKSQSNQRTEQMNNQENAYQTPSPLYGRQMPNSPSTFCSTIILDNQSPSSFKYPYNQTTINTTSASINNSQINRWFDWTMN